MDSRHLNKVITYAFKAPLVRWGVASMLLCGLMLTLVYLFVWQPLAEDQRDLVSQVNTQRSEIVRLSQQAVTQKAYEKTLIDIGAIESKLNSNFKQADIINNLYRIAGRYRVQILNESYKENKKSDGFLELEQEIIVSAKYEGLRKFLIALHSLPTWTVVGETQIDRSKAEDGQVKAVLKLQTYRATVATNSSEANQ